MASIPPKARLAATIIAAVATSITSRWPPLAIALGVLSILLVRAGLGWVFLKFMVVVLGPTALMLILVWGLVCRAPPGAAMGSDPGGGAAYAATISLRLAVLGGVIQLALLSVPSRLLPVTLRGWGLRGEGLVVALGVFAVGPELLLRGQQVITARKARGIAAGGPLASLRELPRLLRPLFVWSIRSAIHRSEAWQQRALLLKVDQLPFINDEWSSAGGMMAVGLSLAWLVVAVLSRFK